MSDGRRYGLTALYAVWVLAFAYAFVAYARARYEGGGFPDGLNKAVVYLGWQGVAGTIAVAVFGLGLGWPKGSGVRRLSVVPLVVAALHVVAVVAAWLWVE